jgi:hypothetical protein
VAGAAGWLAGLGGVLDAAAANLARSAVRCVRAEFFADEIERLAHPEARSATPLPCVLAPNARPRCDRSIARTREGRIAKMASWERAMLQWPNGERCERSRETLQTAGRLMRWRDAAEGCSNCRKRAVAVCGREAFCATCEAQRAARVLEKRRAEVTRFYACENPACEYVERAA